MPELSYLITYRNTGTDRQAGLTYVLNALASLKRIEIILVEQDQAPQVSTKILPGNCRYTFVHNHGKFNKSWGLNIAARQAKAQNLVMADADILLTQEGFEKIISHFQNGAEAINPYTVLIDLSKCESQALYEGNSRLHVERTEQQINRIERGCHTPFCGGVFALSAELYEQIGGLDERFEGWGAEDDAASAKIAHFSKNAATLTGAHAYHLWHTPVSYVDSKETPGYLRNRALLSAYYEFGDDFYQNLASHDFKLRGQTEKYISADPGQYKALKEPLVSCLCVTRARTDTLRQAINCFQQQAHQHRELIIVCEDDDKETLQFTSALSAPSIKVCIVPANPKLALGSLRNIAIANAKGEYICQWDDDDWYHPRRIELQLKSAVDQNKAASILPRWLIYSPADHKAYCSNVRLWEGSLLCETRLLRNGPGYPALSRGEDTALISWLYVQDQLAIEDRPDLYLYRFSGNNTWNNQHFERILEASTELDDSDTERVFSMVSG